MAVMIVEMQNLIGKYVDQRKPFSDVEIYTSLKKDNDDLKLPYVTEKLNSLHNWNMKGIYEKNSIDAVPSLSAAIEEKPSTIEVYHPYEYNIREYNQARIARTLLAIQKLKEKQEKKDKIMSEVKQSINSESSVKTKAKVQKLTDPTPNKEEPYVVVNRKAQPEMIIEDKPVEVQIQEPTQKPVVTLEKIEHSNSTHFEKNVNKSMELCQKELIPYGLKMMYFDLLIRNKNIHLIPNQKGVIKPLDKDRLYIRVNWLRMANLFEDKKVWVHINKEQILINDVHPDIFKFKEYEGRIIGFDFCETDESEPSARKIYKMIVEVEDVIKIDEQYYIMAQRHLELPLTSGKENDTVFIPVSGICQNTIKEYRYLI